MFVKKEEYNNLIKKINKLEENQIREIGLYEFYLERKLEEINCKLKHKITYETEMKGMFLKILTIKLGSKEIETISMRGLYINTTKEVLNYLNSKSITYFKRLDKKLIEAEKEIDEILKN